MAAPKTEQDIFAPTAAREIGDAYVGSQIGKLRQAVAYALSKTGWPEKRKIRVGEASFEMSTQLPSELGGIVESLSLGKKCIPKSALAPDIVSSSPGLLAVLFVGGLINPKEWEGVIEEIKEEEPRVETGTVIVFRRIFEMTGQPDQFTGSGGTRYEFNPDAKAGIAKSIHRFLEPDIEKRLNAANIAQRLIEHRPELAELRREGTPLETLTAIVHYVLFES